jgi:hypothetical protein
MTKARWPEMAMCGHRTKYRVLEMVEDPETGETIYQVKVYDRTTDDAQSVVIEPSTRGGGKLEEIPFVVDRVHRYYGGHR